MEVARKRLREVALNRFKYIRTCMLARELCLLVRTNIAALTPKDVQECCKFIASICEEAGCKDPSELCRRAAEIVLNDEEKYLELCQQSCAKCGESRAPRRREPRYIY